MALTIRRTGAADYGRYIKMLVCGHPGSGKTVLGATSIDPLIVDCEGGLMSIADRNVPYAEMGSTLDLMQLLTALDQEDEVTKEMLGFVPGTVVIDTIDEVQKMFERERLKETKRDALNMQDFGWLKDRMLDVIRSFRNLDTNVIFLCHIKEVTDEESGTVSMKPGLKGAVADEIAAYMDIVGVIVPEEYRDVDGAEMVQRSRRVLVTTPDRRHDWLKDRSWKLPGRIALNGKTDFKRIHATVFKETPPESPEEREVQIAEEPAVDVIEREPEQPANPISDNSDNSDEKEEKE
jgi:hypothetical protein